MAYKEYSFVDICSLSDKEKEVCRSAKTMRPASYIQCSRDISRLTMKHTMTAFLNS